MATLKERIVELLQNEDGYTDREITDKVIGIGQPQQSVNIACRDMETRGMIRRSKRKDGKIGNFLGDTKINIVKEIHLSDGHIMQKTPAVLWIDLRSKAILSEFEIHIVPQNKSVPLWFQVGIKDKHLIIKKAKHNTPSVNISMDRLITYKDFEFVYHYYDRWLKGDTSSRQEASRKSQNTAYIFALIAEVTKVKV